MPLSNQDFIDQVHKEVDFRYESYSFTQGSKDAAFAQWIMELLFPLIDTDLAFSLLADDEVWKIKAHFKEEESGNFYLIFCHYSEEPLQQKFGIEVVNNVFNAVKKIENNIDILLEGDSILSEAAKALKEDYMLIPILVLFGDLENQSYLENSEEVGLVYYNYEQLLRTSAGVTEDIPSVSVILPFISSAEYFGPVEAVIGNISAYHLKKALVGLTPEIYDVNLRVPLGLTKINKAMRQTLASNKNKYFWYFNNGITVLCKGFKKDGNDNNSYKIESPRIVNGAQTTDTILSSEFDEQDEVNLLIRIIAALPGSEQVRDELEDSFSLQDLYLDIARFTNSQNPIEMPDFRSNDLVQKRLYDEFLELGWFYEHRRGQWQTFSDKDSYRNKRINMIDLAQRWFSFSGQPSIAIKEKYSLFEDQGYYGNIFMLARSAEEYLVANSIFERILELLKNQIQNAKQEEQKVINEGGRLSFGASRYLTIGRATKLTTAHMTALLGESLRRRYDSLKKHHYKQIYDVVETTDFVEKAYPELKDTIFRFIDQLRADKYQTLHRALSERKSFEELLDTFEYVLSDEIEKGRDILLINFKEA